MINFFSEYKIVAMAVAAVPQNLVDELRETFLKEVSAKGLDSVHPKDYERVKNDDHWLRRFLAHNKQNIPQAIKMMWTSLTWRKEFNVNDISEKNIKMDLIIKGVFFSYGKDIKGKTLFILKGKQHTKGAVNAEDLKRCIIYWFERTERMVEGQEISLFFDMEGCGLTNMDMDLIKYLIGLFKEYYPYFLNYIIIFEMAWVLSAAFKVIKSWLPEEAIEKIKFVGKKDISTVVPPNEALKSWGGESTYVFSFIPEETEKPGPDANNSAVKKVHFVDGSPMSEQRSHSPEPQEDGPLKVNPPGIITFVREKNDLVSTLELHNTDPAQQIAYKLKTTSPEKFRVKPSHGKLLPGAKESVTVTLLQGFQLGGLSKDKFLVMCCVLDEKEVPNLDLSEMWKNTGNKKIYQNRLRCVQSGEITRNGNTVNHVTPTSDEDNHLAKLSATLNEINDNQKVLNKSVIRMQKIQIALFVFSVLLGVILFSILNKSIQGISTENQYCSSQNKP